MSMTDKEDEIKELREQRDLLLQENAELREKQRWIPVTERLPEDFTRVLIFLPYENHPEVPPRRAIGSYDSEYNHWVVNSMFVHPSHWMPLPPKPEVGE